MKLKKAKRDGVLVMVYGTLQKGNKNEHYLDEAYNYLGKGETVRSNLALVNMTGVLGHWFPGAVELNKPYKKQSSIRGEIYLIPRSLLKRLDAHEGCYQDTPRVGNMVGYYRKRLSIKLDRGGRVVCEVYLMSPERAIKGIEGGGNIVLNGIWKEPREARQARLARENLSHLNYTPRKLSLSYQPTPLALARARARFTKGA